MDEGGNLRKGYGDENVIMVHIDNVMDTCVTTYLWLAHD